MKIEHWIIIVLSLIIVAFTVYVLYKRGFNLGYNACLEALRNAQAAAVAAAQGG